MVFWGLVSALGVSLGSAAVPPRSNVLFIAIDDLRPELGCYGREQIVSPNIDRLAASGLTFGRAYCQQAICNASRASLMTGLRPDTIGVHDLTTHFRTKVPSVITLPQRFKESGYHAQALGKVYHPAFPGFGIGSDLGDPMSWSEPSWLGGPRYYYSPLGVKLARELYEAKLMQNTSGGPNWVAEARARNAARKDVPQHAEDWKMVNVRVLATEAPDVPDSALYDGEVTDRAIGALRRLQSRAAPSASGPGQPFFLAVGYLKPHLPFVAPKKYWDLYDPSRIELAGNPHPPRDVPAVAMRLPMDELRDTYPKDVRVGPGSERGEADPDGATTDIPKRGPLTQEQERRLRHGYYACVSFIDAQVGRLLDELERLGLSGNTIVLLYGDHGFSLGEHGLWGKLTNFEDANRSPLIVSVPGAKAPGRTTDALVELVDIYPSLCELAGVTPPAELEGTSFAPLVDDPDQPWKTAAFSQYPRGEVMGYSIRTNRHRFTQWQSAQDPNRVEGLELYDHVTDPAENRNLAALPENAVTVRRLTEQLRLGWKHARQPILIHGGVD